MLLGRKQHRNRQQTILQTLCSIQKTENDWHKMDNNLNRKILIKVSIACTIFLLLIIFYYHIEKYTTGSIYIFLTLLIPISFVYIVIYLIKGLIQIFRNKKPLSIIICLPFFITLSTLIYLFFSPYRLDSEKFGSKVRLRACFEGTQNQAFILFRENQTFEINWTSVFFSNSWYYGTYIQKADTFYLNYTTEKPYRFGDTIVNNGLSLITINKHRIDSNQYFVPFYIGYCKGLN